MAFAVSAGRIYNDYRQAHPSANNVDTLKEIIRTTPGITDTQIVALLRTANPAITRNELNEILYDRTIANKLGYGTKDHILTNFVPAANPVPVATGWTDAWQATRGMGTTAKGWAGAQVLRLPGVVFANTQYTTANSFTNKWLTPIGQPLGALTDVAISVTKFVNDGLLWTLGKDSKLATVESYLPELNRKTFCLGLLALWQTKLVTDVAGTIFNYTIAPIFGLVIPPIAGGAARWFVRNVPENAVRYGILPLVQAGVSIVAQSAWGVMKLGAQEVFNVVTSPTNLVKAATTTAAVGGLWFVYNYVPEMIHQHLVVKFYTRLFGIVRPKIATEQKMVDIGWVNRWFKQPITSRYNRLYDYVFGVDPSPRPIFANSIQKEFDRISRMVKEAKENGRPLPSLLLEGPPGTGKTMMAKEIAKKAGLNYIKMASTESAGTAVSPQQIRELLRTAKSSPTPTIIFVDEIDAFGIDRDSDKASPAQVANLITFLDETGDDTVNKIMIIGATNRRKVLDPALLRRMPEKMHVGTPDYTARVGILKQYVDLTFVAQTNKTIFPDWLHQKFVNRRPAIAPACLQGKGLQALAAKTKGLSGSALAHLVNILVVEQEIAPDRKLTEERLDRAVYKYVVKERKDMPQQNRSYRIVEWYNDFWNFTIPSYLRSVGKLLPWNW